MTIHRPYDRGSTHLWNVGVLQRDYTVLYPRKLVSSYLSAWEPDISYSYYLECCKFYFLTYIVMRLTEERFVYISFEVSSSLSTELEVSSSLSTELVFVRYLDHIWTALSDVLVDLGGLLLSALANGPKVRGFKPVRGRWSFIGDKYP
jgi:hypothetical protein